MRHAIIGDIHGRYRQLEKILYELCIFKTLGGWRNSKNYHIVQLGDLNDYQAEGDYSSVRALEIMMELTKAGIATVLYSNHHDKLMRYLNGNKITPSHGLTETIKELDECSLDFKGELYTWLSKLPCIYEFIENKKSYICAHAFFDEYMFKQMNSDPHWDETKKSRDFFEGICIYGKRTTVHGTERVKWWDEDCTNLFKSFHFIGGHYHVEKFADNYTLLDNDDFIVCWIPSTGEVIREPK